MMKKRAKRSHTARRSQSDNGLLLWGLFIGTCLVAVSVVIALATTAQPAQPVQPSQSGSTASSAPHYPQGDANRTITFGKAGTLDTDKDHALVGIIKGSLPVGTTQVTVISDENCTPDSQGTSHCLNRLSYGSGEITVLHTHQMTQVPCLQPGEVLQVVTATS